MRRFVEGIDRGQGTLFPECLEDWIDENSPVRVIDALVGKLDLSRLGVFGQLNLMESLDSMLAPYSFGDAEDGIFLGWADGCPFLNEGRNQRSKFFFILSGNDRGSAEDSVFESVVALLLRRMSLFVAPASLSAAHDDVCDWGVNRRNPDIAIQVANEPNCDISRATPLLLERLSAC